MNSLSGVTPELVQTLSLFYNPQNKRLNKCLLPLLADIHTLRPWLAARSSLLSSSILCSFSATHFYIKRNKHCHTT